MSDIMLANGDLVATNNGDIAVVSGDDEIVQSAITHIMTVLGEMDLHKEIGNDIYNRRVKMTASNLNIVANECRFAIMQDGRISNVQSIYATQVDDTKCQVDFTILTVDNHVISSNAVVMFR